MLEGGAVVELLTATLRAMISWMMGLMPVWVYTSSTTKWFRKVKVGADAGDEDGAAAAAADADSGGEVEMLAIAVMSRVVGLLLKLR